MRHRFSEWLAGKWRREFSAEALAEDYRAIFSTEPGRRVLRHWLDTVYCRIYEGNDPQELWQHEAQRAFVHQILENIDMAERPEKYRQPEEHTAWMATPTR